jgi:hypothetical protein
MSVNTGGTQPVYPTAYAGGSQSSTGKPMPIVLILVVGFLLSMWDVYFQQLGLRVLDLIGIGLLFFWMLWASFRTRNFQILFLMIFWSLVLGIVGVIRSMENVKPTAGILMGVAVFCYFYSIRLDWRSVEKMLSIVIEIHASYLIFQYLYYKNFGIVLNAYGFLGGEEPRALSSIFRPTGLFLEPAAYSVSMLMLLTLRIFITKVFDKLTFLALGSIFLTLSLWGWICSIIFILMFSRRNIVLFVAVTIAILFIFVAFAFIDSDWIKASDNPWSRLMRLGDDSSANVRFAGLISDDTYTLTSINLWFGQGISNDYHDFGSNGLAFIVSAGGLFGTSVFIILLSTLIPRSRKFIILAFILLYMTAAPMFTMAFWWFWLALMMRPFECNGGLELIRK